jgi:hypothetical protein
VKYCLHLFIILRDALIVADITELLIFRHKSILAGDLNAKHPFWNSGVSNLSGEILLRLFDVNQFEISAPPRPTHYSPAGNGDVLDIVVYQNIRVSDVIVSDILDCDHLPIIFHLLDHDKVTYLSKLIEKITYWDRFRSLVSELISPRIEIKSGLEAKRVARDFRVSVVQRIGCRQVRVHLQTPTTISLV